MEKDSIKVVLVSASPRRAQLLKDIIDDFRVISTDSDESFTEATPEANVMKVAMNKATAIEFQPDDIVIGSDTTVFMDGKYYNKPESYEDAVRILKALSGRRHTVYTGVAVIYRGQRHMFYDKADVTFYDLSDNFIYDYVATGSPLDKAGAYGIQDEGIVKSYEGDYSTIMGLPKRVLRDKLREITGHGL